MSESSFHLLVESLISQFAGESVGVGEDWRSLEPGVSTISQATGLGGEELPHRVRDSLVVRFLGEAVNIIKLQLQFQSRF